MLNSGGNASLPRGANLLHDPRLNKSTAFSEAEREAMGLIGLLPEGVDTEELQLQRVHVQLSQKTTDLERYIFLSLTQAQLAESCGLHRKETAPAQLCDCPATAAGLAPAPRRSALPVPTPTCRPPFPDGGS